MYGAIRYAATFQDEVEELVDVEEANEEDTNKTKWLYGSEEAELD